MSNVKVALLVAAAALAACVGTANAAQRAKASTGRTPMVQDWSTSFAPLIAERHPDWNDRLDGEIARNGPDADAAGLAIARAWVATI